MKFLNEQGQEITLKRAKNLPGYEVTLSEDVVIDSAVNNPFFKGINVLQLPKKLKGFRDNPDLKNLLAPVELNSGLIVDLMEDEFIIFELNKELSMSKRLILVNQYFGKKEIIKPQVINFGIKKVKIKSDEVIGTILVLNTK